MPLRRISIMSNCIIDKFYAIIISESITITGNTKITELTQYADVAPLHFDEINVIVTPHNIDRIVRIRITISIANPIVINVGMSEKPAIPFIDLPIPSWPYLFNIW